MVYVVTVMQEDGRVLVDLYLLCSDPHCPLVLCSCQAQARAVPLAQPSLSIVNPPPAGDTSSEVNIVHGRDQ